MVTEKTDGDDAQIRISTKPRNPDVRRMYLRNRKRVNYKKVAYPKVNKIIQLAIKHVDSR